MTKHFLINLLFTVVDFTLLAACTCTVRLGILSWTRDDMLSAPGGCGHRVVSGSSGEPHLPGLHCGLGVILVDRVGNSFRKH